MESKKGVAVKSFNQFIDQSGPIIDVRSPSEFKQGHIPSAISVPLFTNEERAVVGTTYKQIGRQEAILTGLDYYGPKMRTMLEQIIDSRSSTEETVRIYCWRGGMRSRAVGWLADLYGFDVNVLEGGYKSFRRYVLDSFTQVREFVIIGGNTGTGKTRILKRLINDYPVIDFEGIAKHKGSAFGHLGQEIQPSQEMFENDLIYQLDQVNRQYPNMPLLVEDESQRIGNVAIPREIWNHMLNATILQIELPFEIRLENIVNEYAQFEDAALIDAIKRITKRLGPQHAKKAIELILEGEKRASFSILLAYYDKLYQRNIEKRLSTEQPVKCITITAANEDQAFAELKYHIEKIYE